MRAGVNGKSAVPDNVKETERQSSYGEDWNYSGDWINLLKSQCVAGGPKNVFAGDAAAFASIFTATLFQICIVFKTSKCNNCHSYHVVMGDAICGSQGDWYFFSPNGYLEFVA